MNHVQEEIQVTRISHTLCILIALSKQKIIISKNYMFANTDPGPKSSAATAPPYPQNYSSSILTLVLTKMYSLWLEILLLALIYNLAK